MDEFAAVIKAREFVRKVNPAGIPVRVEAYVEEAKAVLRRQTDLGAARHSGHRALRAAHRSHGREDRAVSSGQVARTEA